MSACSLMPSDNRAAFEATTDMVPAARPMAQLPAAAGEQIAVLQSNVQGPIQQKIVLRGDPATGGENRIVVTVDLDQPLRGAPDYNIPKPTEELIAKELDDNFPGIAMAISQYWVRNDFGPFGYATGHAYGGVTCIYAWQWAPGQPTRFIANLEAQAAEASTAKAPTSVRVRLCKQGMGESELVELIHQMAVYAPGSSTPYVDTSYGPRPMIGADSLSSTGVPRSFYFGNVDPEMGVVIHKRVAVNEDIAVRHTKHRKRHHGQARHRHTRAADRDIYEPVNVSPLAGRGVLVPFPGEGEKANASGANPLLAPLQHMQAASPSAPRQAASSLPLPPASSASSASAPAAPTPAAAPSGLPLPQ